MNQIDLLTARRRTTTFVGCGTVCNKELNKQQVTLHGQYKAPGSDDPEGDDMWRISTADGKTYVAEGFDLMPHPLDPLDNSEFVELMLNHSSSVLMHPFILIAIEEYAKQVVKASREELGGDRSMIDPDAWRSMALEAMGWFAARQAADEIRRQKLAPTG